MVHFSMLPRFHASVCLQILQSFRARMVAQSHLFAASLGWRECRCWGGDDALLEEYIVNNKSSALGAHLRCLSQSAASWFLRTRILPHLEGIQKYASLSPSHLSKDRTCNAGVLFLGSWGVHGFECRAVVHVEHQDPAHFVYFALMTRKG